MENESAKEFFDVIEKIYLICVSRENIQPIIELLKYADDKQQGNTEKCKTLQNVLIKGYRNLSITD